MIIHSSPFIFFQFCWLITHILLALNRNSKVLLKDLQIKRQLTTVEERTVSPPVPAAANKNSPLKATPIVQPTTASAAPRPVTSNKLPDKKVGDEYDDDDDVHSGVNQPVVQVRKKSSTSTNVPSGAAMPPNNGGGKELTPKERLLLNKLKKADEEAAKVGYAFAK